MSPNIQCHDDVMEQRTDDAQQLQESDDPSSSSQMPRAEEIDQKFEENPLTSDLRQIQESAVLSGSLSPKAEVLDQNVNPSEGTCNDLQHLKNSSSSQPPNTELLDQNVTLHPTKDTCGVKQPAAVLIYPFLLPKAEVQYQNFQEQAVAGSPLGSPEQDASAPLSHAQHQTVYLVNGGFPQTQSSPIQKPKGQRRRVCTRADCPFCNILPCGTCRPCTNPDSRSRCILR
jgi:hypothetical protein